MIKLLSDNPKDPGQIAKENDIFHLHKHLQPLLDIFCSKDTETPITVGIYGLWGSGKTSAMKWLEGQLTEQCSRKPKKYWVPAWLLTKKQRQKRSVAGPLTCKPVWFFPWKYHEPEDIWKGLISEVIVHLKNRKNFCRRAIRELSPVLGRTLCLCAAMHYNNTHVLRQIDLDRSAESLDRLAKGWQKTAHPEIPYLNEFEDILKKWIDRYLPKNQRLVVFVDDLDRCLPDVALRVLEAMKLYLNMPRIIFVVGIDRTIVEKAIKAYCTERHFNYGDDGNTQQQMVFEKRFLDKIFQVDLHLAPSEKEIGAYLDYLLEQVGYQDRLKENAALLPDFREVILYLGHNNPREIKRVINSSLIRGEGSLLKLETSDREDSCRSFAQGVQMYFIQKILAEKHNRSDLVGDKQGDEFFARWSKIVVGKGPGFEGILKFELPADYCRWLKEFTCQAGQAAVDEKVLTDLKRRGDPDVVEAFRDVLVDEKVADLCSLLLNDEHLGKLMKIPYSESAAEYIRDQKPTQIQLNDSQVIMGAIARSIGEMVYRLSESSYSGLHTLVLSGMQLTDISLLEKCKSLAILKLDLNRISRLEPLGTLTGLQELNLYCNKIMDITPLKSLTGLQELNLTGNQITSIKALQDICGLKFLSAQDNRIEDLTPLKNMPVLSELYLEYNQISDISVLRDRASLKKLRLHHNRIAVSQEAGDGKAKANYEALRSLESLELLFLRNNRQIADITFLEKMTKLTELRLGYNEIRDIEPLKKLQRLRFLQIGHNELKHVDSLAGLQGLEELCLADTRISDLTPLQGLTRLRELWLEENQISDIEPLTSLCRLHILWLSGNQIAGLPLLSGKWPDLRELSLDKNKLTDISELQNLTRLKKLWLSGNEIRDIAALASCPELVSLSLDNNRDCCVNLEPLQRLKSLERLSLRNLKSVKDQLDAIEKLGNRIKVLSLEGCGLSEADLKRLRQRFAGSAIPDVEDVVQGKPFRLFRPQADELETPSTVLLFDKDRRLSGNGKYEKWRKRDGYLELLEGSGDVYSRFCYDPERGQFLDTNDSDTESCKNNVLNQYMVRD